MSSSNLYRIHPDSKTLQGVREVNFSDHRFRERYDIQEWIEKTPSILGERLLIIAKEKTCFAGTKERPDLIAIDKDGNVVIVELKRDDSGGEVHWQAIKYASYWSRFSISDILRVFADYLTNQRQVEEREEVDEEYAKQEIIDFIDQDTLDNVNTRQRIVLVSHRYSKEVISAVDWLFENYGTDIRCVQLIPYFDEDRETYYLQSNVLLPVAGIDEYLVKPFSGKTASVKSSRGSKNDDEVTIFCGKIRDELLSGGTLKSVMRPTRYSRWAGRDYRFRYYHFWYKEGLWDNWGLSYKVWLYNDFPTNKLYKNKVRVFFVAHKKHLLENGVTEKKYDELSRSLKRVCDGGNELQYISQADSLSVEYLLAYKKLDDGLRDRIGVGISSVISATYNNVVGTLTTVGDSAEQFTTESG
jgi:hypothetical protein